MCTINSFVGYAIVKSKTSGIFIFLYRFTQCQCQLCCLSMEIVVNVNMPSRINSCYSCVGLSLLTHDPEGHPK